MRAVFRFIVVAVLVAGGAAAAQTPLPILVPGVQAGKLSAAIERRLSEGLLRAGFNVANARTAARVLGAEKAEAWMKCAVLGEGGCPPQADLAAFQLVITARLIGKAHVELIAIRPDGSNVMKRDVNVWSIYDLEDEVEKTATAWGPDLAVVTGHRYRKPPPWRTIGAASLAPGVIGLAGGSLVLYSASTQYAKLTARGHTTPLDPVVAYRYVERGERDQALGLAITGVGVAFTAVGLYFAFKIPGKTLDESSFAVGVTPGGVSVGGTLP